MSRSAKLYFYSLRNSLSDLIVPDPSYWIEYMGKNPGKYTKAHFMYFLLWAVWVINLFYMVVILLNFLISIVSKTHDEAIVI